MIVMKNKIYIYICELLVNSSERCKVLEIGPADDQECSCKDFLSMKYVALYSFQITVVVIIWSLFYQT